MQRRDPHPRIARSRPRITFDVPKHKTLSVGEGLQLIDMLIRRAGDSNPEGIAPGGFQDRCLTN